MHARLHVLRRSLLALLAVTLAQTPLPAQTPDQQAALAEFETALDRLVSPDTLKSLLRSDDASQGGTPIPRIRRALVDARLGEVTGDLRAFGRALDALSDVARQQASWPYVWYSIGRTRLKLSQTGLELPSPGWDAPDSTDAGKAVAALGRALQADPTFRPADSVLARARIEQVGAPLLAAAYAERRSGGDSAVRAVHRYLALGGDSGIGYLELAGALVDGDRAIEASEAYGVAADHALTPASVARLRRDLVWIADSAELGEFDRLADSARGTWVDAFWERRDVIDARRPGERLVEHLRRLSYAEREFRRGTSRRFAGFGDRYRGPPSDLDDRAVIYIRHGPPDERAIFSRGFPTKENMALTGGMNPETGAILERVSEHAADIPANLSWKYRRPEGDLIFHFVARSGQDYRLIESLLDVFSADTVIRLQAGMSRDHGEMNGPGYDDTQFAIALFESRAGLDPLYARLSAGSGLRATRSLTLERETGRRTLALGTTTDSYRAVHKAWMPAVVQGYGVAAASGGRALVVFAVPVAALSEPTTSEASELVYPLQFRLVLSTPDEHRIMQIDTVRTFTVKRQLGDRDYLTGYFELPTSAGHKHVRVVVVSPGRDVAGSGSATALEVPPPLDAGRLTLSDLVLGSESSDLAWPGPDGPVSLNPLGAYRKGSEARLYYQVGGLRRGETIRTTIDVTPADSSGRRNHAASTFTAQAGAEWQSERREVSLEGLKPGDYVLSLTVRTDGGSATRRATVTVTKR